MDRRTFLGVATSASATLAGVTFGPRALRAEEFAAKASPFHLKFAPHFGMFANVAGKDLVDQLRFAADQGFRAWEDNPMRTRSLEDQQRVAAAMGELGIEMGTISALNKFGYELHFAGGEDGLRAKVLEEIKLAVEVARRVRARWMTLILGSEHPKLPVDLQTASCIELLHRGCDIVEPHGITLIMEPLNHEVNHPGVFLHKATQGYLIAKAVNRPGCKLLFDIYHEQIAAGDLVRHIDLCWDQIAYLQCADNPGRKEPGTGEINYRHVFRHLHEKGWQGIMGMEHGNARPGADGDRAVIAAYRQVDPS